MAAPNHKVAAEREVAVLLRRPVCLLAYVQCFRSIDDGSEKREGVPRRIYFSDPKFMYDLPTGDPKIESFLIVERRALSI